MWVIVLRSILLFDVGNRTEKYPFICVKRVFLYVSKKLKFYKCLFIMVSDICSSSAVQF